MDIVWDKRMALPSVKETVKSREQRYRCLECMREYTRAPRWERHLLDRTWVRMLGFPSVKESATPKEHLEVPR